jgi:hypothetical protein
MKTVEPGETLDTASPPSGNLFKQLRTIDGFQFEKVVAVMCRKQG